MSSTTSKSSPDDLATRPIACLNCRNRRSYCSKDRPACSRCRGNGLACRYKEAKRIQITESRLRALQLKADAYDGKYRLSSQQSIPPADQCVALVPPEQNQGRTDSSADIREDHSEDVHFLLEPCTPLSMMKPLSSSSETLLRSLLIISGLYSDDTSLDAQSSLFELDAMPRRRAACRGTVRLPPLAMARRLFAAQHAYISTIFAFAGPADGFERALIEAYSGSPNPGDSEACLRYAKVLIVLAFGQLYSVNQWVDSRGPPGFDFFETALNLLPDPHELCSILFVETLALVGYFFQNMNCPSSSSVYTGMALRMAISLGLHQEVPGPGDCFRRFSHENLAGRSAEISLPGTTSLDDASREHRRRVWWSVYILDRILTIKPGNPITIQDEEINVQLPSQMPGELDNWSIAVFRHHVQLSRVLGEIHATLYGKTAVAARKSGERLMELVQRILMTLSMWHGDLPDELRFDPAQPSISRQSVSTLSHYYQCVNMTVRPLLLHIVQKRVEKARTGDHAVVQVHDWKTDLSTPTVEVIEMCVSGAKNLIHMMTIAAERDLVATYGYLDGEHIVSATIVLVMVHVVFPDTPDHAAAMDAGLRLLRNMGERGNSHIAARYDLLSLIVQAGKGSENILGTVDTAKLSTNVPGADASDLNTAFTQVGLAEDNVKANVVITQPPFLSHSISSLGSSGIMPNFPALENDFLSELFVDENTAGMDFTLLEEGLTDLSWAAGHDFSQ